MSDAQAGQPPGLMARVVRSLRDRFVGDADAAAAAPAPHPMLLPHAAKLCSAEEAVAHIRHGEHVFVGTACATPRALVHALETRSPKPGDVELLHVDEIDWLMPVDTLVIEFQHDAIPGEVVEQIARYISDTIDDGSTLQIGRGRVTSEALKYLADRKGLGIHSDVITDAITPLLERGILNGKRKADQRGQIVTSFAMGSRRLYDLIDRNPLFSSQPIEAVCQPSVIAAQHRMVSVAQAFAIDLSGQVCADQLDGGYYSGLAAQGEFLRVASRSPGGKPIICLPSTDPDGGSSRIRVQLRPGEGLTIALSDVHYVVTEYGIANLFGKSMRERAIAHRGGAPEFPCRAVRAGAGARPARGRPDAEEHARLPGPGGGDGGAQGQPLGAAAALIRGRRGRHPHALSQPVGTRRLHALLPQRAQPVEPGRAAPVQPQLRDRGRLRRRYRPAREPSGRRPGLLLHRPLDPSTNLAETALIVGPDWQGSGLGTALQMRMMKDAAQRGVRGFVAEIMSTNDAMTRLAKGGWSSVSTESMGSTVRVTALFRAGYGPTCA
ncbi:GNAT family N-acetyltransferase [Piscinibacter sp.]|uniref:GNAT family N-acetyltransferase n=1 Tax=Piscinibacter sp. TaxID=1903157 RepID=UPI002D0D59EC|nr:GNAT family N-acetyltransferase [Albitalea sp.]HUG26259.1 GNAT family N-acetyltransferase [Albitalea sp.]